MNRVGLNGNERFRPLLISILRNNLVRLPIVNNVYPGLLVRSEVTVWACKSFQQSGHSKPGFENGHPFQWISCCNRWSDNNLWVLPSDVCCSCNWMPLLSILNLKKRKKNKFYNTKNISGHNDLEIMIVGRPFLQIVVSIISPLPTKTCAGSR